MTTYQDICADSIDIGTPLVQSLHPIFCLYNLSSKYLYFHSVFSPVPPLAKVFSDYSFAVNLVERVGKTAMVPHIFNHLVL